MPSLYAPPIRGGRGELSSVAENQRERNSRKKGAVEEETEGKTLNIAI